MSFSKTQVQDLLTLRLLFYAHFGRLSLERTSLIAKMGKYSQQVPNVKTWAERIQENVEEEQRMTMQMLIATRFGVSILPAHEQRDSSMSAAFQHPVSSL